MKLAVDTHTHTLASGHAYSTLQENVAQAKKKGLLAFAMTDHGPSLMGASHEIYFWNFRVIPDFWDGVRVFKGAEVNIVDYYGALDLTDRCLSNLEFVNASYHDITIKPSTEEEHTEGMILALKNPLVDAIAHPGNPQFQVDIDRVVRAAAEYNKLIEINNSSFKVRKGCEANCMEFVLKCKKYGVRITTGSDAHVCFDVGNFNVVQTLLEEAGMPEELVITSSLEKLEEYVIERKAAKKAYLSVR